MLGPGRYLLGVLEILWLAGFAGLGGVALRRRLVPELTGAASFLGALVLSLALVIWSAELLGSFGLLEPVPLLLLIGVVGGAARLLVHRPSHQPGRAGGRGVDLATAVALLVALVAVVHFAGGVRTRLSTGMTGFDSTWYHGPLAAGFFQSGDTWHLHHIAPQFLAWFYPANGEIFHAAGMLAFDRDLLSPFLNLGWFCGCLLACWTIGRPARVAPWSLALGAIALSVPALADQAGEARNDLAATFFLLAAIGIAVNAWAARGEEEPRLSSGALLLGGLAAGLAAGTKLNYLLPAAVLVIGLAVVCGPGRRARALGIAGLGALAGGGYWYLRNLFHTGNPLPWFAHLGPISLPAPTQELGGRETHSVLGYLGNGSVWSEWFLPGLHHGLWILWPLLLAGALVGVVLGLGRRAGPVTRVAALTAAVAAVAWLVAPTSASGPDGHPSGFESGLRYLAPALILALALLPTVPQLRSRLAAFAFPSALVGNSPTSADGRDREEAPVPRGRKLSLVGVALVLFVVIVGYPVQRHYLESRYADPSFSTPGLNSAFRWARDISGARIATTSTRQYPLFGTDLSNEVKFIGEDRPHGGYVAPTTCRAWRRLIDEGEYDYVVASRDRVEPGKPPYPPTARWTEGPRARLVLAVPPTKVFRITGRLNPSAC